MNILKRFKIHDDVRDLTEIFYPYQLQDGDRPDVVAEKYYGNANYAWLVLFSNNIVDPVKEWPLYGTDFRNYLVTKYGSIESANTTVKKRYKVLSAAFSWILELRSMIFSVSTSTEIITPSIISPLSTSSICPQYICLTPSSAKAFVETKIKSETNA